jgi:hypothetical protein
LDSLADRVEGKAHEGTQSLEAAFARLKESILASDSGEAQATLTAREQAFLSLSERITGLAVSLGKEI